MEVCEKIIKDKIKTGQIINIAIVKDQQSWHNKFADALEQQTASTKKIFSYSIVNLDTHDWLEAIQPFDIVIWRPFCLGPEAVSRFKEKLFFINKYLKKFTLPNFETIWHYDSKIAQSYIFQSMNIPTPKTIISQDLDEATRIISKINYPVVVKKSWGAASNNVRLLLNKKEAQFEIGKIFHQTYWDTNKDFKAIKKISFIKEIWFWEKIRSRFIDPKNINLRFPYIYLQEFIKENSQDLRVTVIGDKYAFGFWRNNRRDDFRASGSGNIDYTKVVPKEIIKQLMILNEILNFDSMAYDILFEKNSYKITEMSYTYDDLAIFNAPGYYEKKNDKILFHNTHTWPQTLWVEWLISKLDF